MKINIIGTGLFKSGGMRVIFEYANRLTRRGHDIYFYFPFKPYNYGKDDLTIMLKRFYGGIKDYIFKRNEVKQFYDCSFHIAGVPKISNIYVRDAHASIATQWPTAFDVDKLSKNKGKKVYFAQDYEIWGSDKDMVDETFRLNLKRITISKYNQRLFYQKFNNDSEVILNGINYEIYDCKNKFLNSNKTITFVEHYLSNKGVSNAIEVVKKLKEKYSNLQFICFGHEKYHDIPEFVKFYENPDDKTVVEKIYGKTDIFIYPSIKEGFGLPPAEAMSCKCAVVTTTVGAIPEYSVHMESAIHVEPNNVNGLFEGVCYLLDNESELKRISNEGYKMVRSILSWDKSVEKFENFLLDM